MVSWFDSAPLVFMMVLLDIMPFCPIGSASTAFSASMVKK
jgi:hypothetical protein